MFYVLLTYFIINALITSTSVTLFIPSLLHERFFPYVLFIVNMWCVLPKTDTFVQEIKIELIIDNESRDLQLYNDSFLILIGRAEAELRNFLFVFTKTQNGVIAL